MCLCVPGPSSINNHSDNTKAICYNEGKCRKVTSSSEIIRIKAKIMSCGHFAFLPPAQLFVSHIKLLPTIFCCSFKRSRWSCILIAFILNKLQSPLVPKIRGFEKHMISFSSRKACPKAPCTSWG